MAHNHFNPVRVWPDYGGPASNYASRVGVGIRAVPTCKTSKQIASLTVGLLDMTANAAFPGSIARIDKTDSNPSTLGFVPDLALQVSEGPRVQRASLRPGSSDPGADAIEVFDGYTASGAFGSIDNLFRNNMIHMRRKSGFFATTLLEQPFSAFGAFRLELFAQPECPSAECIKVCSAEILAVASGSNIHDANVYPEPAKRLMLFGVRHIDSDKQVEFSVTKDEIGFATLVLEQGSLVGATNERDTLTAVDCPDIGGISPPRQDPSIVRDGPQRPERSTTDFVEFVGVSDLGDASHDYLRGHSWKFRASVVISELMEGELPEDLSFPGAVGNPVASSISSTDRSLKRSKLLSRRLELNLHHELHFTMLAVSILEASQAVTSLRSIPNGRVSALETV